MTIRTKQGHQGLRGLEELGGGDAIFSIDGDIGEGPLDGVEPGLIGGNCGHICESKKVIDVERTIGEVE